MNKFYIILIAVLGLFLVPTVTFACKKPSVNHSYTKNTSKTEKKNCCAKMSHSKDKNDDDCSGKCKHSMCSCTFACNGGITFFNESQFNTNFFRFYSEKEKFYNSETVTSAGFYSLWLIPKIS